MASYKSVKHLCFAQCCSSCVLFGNQMWEEKTLSISLILEMLFSVFVGRYLPELSNPDSKMMLTWSQPPRETVWCCSMGGPWEKNLPKRCCICSPFSFLMLPFTSLEAGPVATINCTSYSHSVKLFWKIEKYTELIARNLLAIWAKKNLQYRSYFWFFKFICGDAAQTSCLIEI